MNTRDLILQALEQGSVATKQLLAFALEKRGITKQAFYKILRDLLHEEKITIHGKRISLSLVWIAQQQQHLTTIAEAYGLPQKSGQLPTDTSKSIYSFKTLQELDIFLSHLFLLLYQKTSGPIFVYNQHEWFSYGRETTNEALISTATKTNRPICITVTESTPLDKALAPSLNKKPLQYFMSTEKIFPDHYAYNIYGEYVIKTKMNTAVSEKLSHWFITHRTFTKEAQVEIQEIVRIKGKNIVTIQKNSLLATKLKNKLKKYFVI